jgi:hypothetical protein
MPRAFPAWEQPTIKLNGCARELTSPSPSRHATCQPMNCRSAQVPVERGPLPSRADYRATAHADEEIDATPPIRTPPDFGIPHGLPLLRIAR